MQAKILQSYLPAILIVVFICAALIALLLPATQKVREASQHTMALNKARDAEQAKFAEKEQAEKKEVPAGNQKQDVQRKVIYTAEMDLLIEDLAKAQESLEKLIEEYQGLVAQSEIQGTTGAKRSGRWKVRIPVAKFNSFRAAVVKLGEVLRNSVDSKDVTEEYYDIKQRIKNKKVEEERLLEHLKKSTGTLKDILDVERELGRVREDVERLEGRMNVLENLTSLTTITVHFQERHGYIPLESPSFATTIDRTFHGSIQLLLGTGRVLVLCVVAVGPWVIVLGLVVSLIWWGYHGYGRSAKRAEKPAE